MRRSWALYAGAAAAAIVAASLSLPERALAAKSMDQMLAEAARHSGDVATKQDPRFSLSHDLELVAWPTKITVAAGSAGDLRVFVAVFNPGKRSLGIHRNIRLGLGLDATAELSDGTLLQSTVPEFRVGLTKEDFMSLPPGHLYGLSVAPTEIFPDLAAEGEYTLRFRYANPFRVQTPQGGPPFLGHTEAAVVEVTVVEEP